MKLTTLFLIQILFLFISCQNEDKEITQPSYKGFAVILENIEENKRFTFKSGITSRSADLCELSWVNDNSSISTYCLDPNASKDTLRISSESSSLQIAHKIKGLDYYFYHLQNGDTLFLEYDKFQLPVARNGSNMEHQNLFRNFYDKFWNNKIDPSIYLRSDYSRQIFSRWNEIKDNPALRRMKADYINLDSIYQLTEANFKKQLSDVQNSTNEDKARISGILKKMRYRTFLESANPRYNPHNKSFYAGQSYESNLISDRIYFKTFFNSFLKNDYLTAGIPKPKPEETDLSRYFTQLGLQEAVFTDHIDQIESYLKEYSEIYKEKKDEHFITQLKVENGISPIKSNLVLKDMNGAVTDLKSIVNSNKDIWYVDFWASWCAPCRQAMPRAKALYEKHKADRIGFIYLAFNDKESNWKRASEEDGIDNFNFNYLILNSRSSDYISDINLTSLPRYMVLDSEGKILASYAPGPGDKSISSYFRDIMQL